MPEFYAYYADYDWVLFCSLFGTMMDLPKGFPMYCNDLKQTLDDKANILSVFQNEKCPTFEKAIEYITSSKPFPKQTNEHNALRDAKWNFELYKFLENIN